MPRRPINPELLVVELAQFGPAVRWLRTRDVSPGTLAALFDTTPGNIAVLAHRAQAAVHVARRSLDLPPIDLGAALGQELSFEESEPVRTRAEAKDLDALRDSMERVVGENANHYRFLHGARELGRLRPYLGRPREARRMELVARLHGHKAWFFTHAGWSQSSILEAQQSHMLAVQLYRQSHSPAYLQLIADAALVASNSYLIRSDPARSRRCLDVASQAHAAMGTQPNQEYYRQLAVVAFEEGQDKDARHHFARAREAALRHGQEEGEAGLLMASARQANLLAPVDWDKAQEVLQVCSRRFPPGTLEFSINVNWTAACGLCTDSPHAQGLAAELIEQHSHLARRFGHQSTVASLLQIAPGLPPSIRADFVRFALYQNAFHNR